MTDKVVIGGAPLGLAELSALYRGAQIRIDASVWPRIDAAAKIVANAAAGGTPVYGVNTGFGKLASQRIASADTAQLQRNLILSHCCGVGPAVPRPIVRLIMALKTASLSRGASGVRRDVVALLAAMLDHDIVPEIPAQGSVGASGDLAPLAHMTAVMMGEGRAWRGDSDVLLPGAAQFMAAGLTPITLAAKEGLALINGTQFSTAYALAGLFEAHALLSTALITGALSVDAAMASTTPFRPEIHALRGLPGQITAAQVLNGLLDGSIIRLTHLDNDERVQDPYCLRCQPQVMGACLDLLSAAGRTLAVEANAVTDNPLVLVETGEIVSGGNFHAEPVAFAADQIAIALSEIGAIAERRIATLVDPALNFGLPAFLSPKPGLNSGFMIAEVTAAALYAENKQRAVPGSIDSTPTSANQEDHVSMAAHSARRLISMSENLAQILGIELLVAAQGIDLRKRGFGLSGLKGAHPGALTSSPALERVIDVLRRHVPVLDGDRYMATDIAAAGALANSGAVMLAAGLDVLPRLSALTASAN